MRILIRRRFARAWLLVGLAASLGLAGCGLLDVDNPNNLEEDQLVDNPAAAFAMANGAEAAVTRAVTAGLTPYSTASDELTWIGSRDAWLQLDLGDLNDPSNEFTDGAYPFVAEARWLTREYIRLMEGFQARDRLEDFEALARTYLQGAIIYTTIADLFDNFAFSNRREAAPAIGEEDMAVLYDSAVIFIDKALALELDPAEEGVPNLLSALAGMRARALYGRGLWAVVNPTGDVNTASPLVDSPEAVAAAQAALARMSGDYRYELEIDPVSPNLVADGVADVGAEVSLGSQVNNRQELRISDVYIVPNPEGGSEPQGISLLDPIAGVPSPYLTRFIAEFTAADEFIDVTAVSAREMYLILAEAALAQGNTDEFTTQINALRALDDLPPYTGQIPALEMLQYERQVNLFLQGRRLADHWRFGIPSPQWQAAALDEPGTFLPITIVELRANPNLQQ